MNSPGITLVKIIPLSLDRLEGVATVVDEVDAELFPFFEEEAKTELKAIEELLQGWDTAVAPLKDLSRQFHTLKGAANSIGHLRIGSLAGGMKDLLEQIDPLDTVTLRSQIIKTIIQVVGTIHALLQETKAPKYNQVNKKQVMLAVQAIMRLAEMEGKLQKSHE